ncbi:MAG TPA: heavy metal-associated domain-containing protein [Holophagaceae bacterium]|jgi:hypothetical protein|nr:heavy metal-associated domain-containing protein [Holophagaceae bacterium]
MKIELLVFEGCPNAAPARALLEECLASLGMSQSITEVQVDTPDLAKRLAFPGSPTLRVDDADVAPMEAPAQGSLTCRTYRVGGKLQGVPDRMCVLEALRKAQEAESRACCALIASSKEAAVRSNASGRSSGGTAWAAAGLGLLASACCWIPLALAGAGVAGGAVGARVAWLRPWALWGLALLLAGTLGWWAYRRFLNEKSAADCCAPPLRFPTLPALVLILSFTGAWSAPRLLAARAVAPDGAGVAALTDGGTLLVLSTPQFDCPACAGTLPQTMSKTPGVVSVRMDFDKRETRIRFQHGADVGSILARWDRDLGFSGNALH